MDGAGGATSATAAGKTGALFIDPVDDPHLYTNNFANLDLEVVDGKLCVLHKGNGATVSYILGYDAETGAISGNPASPTDSRLVQGAQWISSNHPIDLCPFYWMTYSVAMARDPAGDLYVASPGYHRSNSGNPRPPFRPLLYPAEFSILCPSIG